MSYARRFELNPDFERDCAMNEIKIKRQDLPLSLAKILRLNSFARI